MRLGSVLFLFSACHGLTEDNIPEELKRNFDRNKIIIPVSYQLGESLYTNVTIGAFTAVLKSLMAERIGMLPSNRRNETERCLDKSRDFTEKAKCFVSLISYFQRRRKRSRNKVLRRIEVQIQRRRKRGTFAGEKDPSINGEKWHIVSKGKYDLLTERDSLLEIFSHHLRKAVARLRGQAMSPLRGWRSLAVGLSSYNQKSAIRKRLVSLLSRRLVSPEIHRRESNTSNKTTYVKDASSLRHLNVLVRKGIQLVATASGHDVEHKPIRLLSPRIGNKKNNGREISVLSPDITFQSQQDEVSAGKNALLELIMEVSGATSGMKEALESMESTDRMLAQNNVQMTKNDVEETLGKKERRKIEVIQRMERTYTPEQMTSFEKRGFTFMTSRQRKIVYGRSSPFHDESNDRRKRELRAVNLERKLINLIRLQAIGTSDYSRRMRIDIISSPTVSAHFKGQPLFNVNSVFSPVILSTFVSSPTLIGPLILSPWLFSAIIASPWALCPIILSPFSFVPIILSPVSMSPFLLSPGIFSPAILSPLLMVPYILSPGLFNPLVLSPLILSPLVLSPSLGSPVILSPALLAPLVLSPLHYSSLILSPSLLSPPIGSEGESSVLILSPDLGAL